MNKNPALEKKQKTHRQWVEGLLVSAQNRKWYGKITITIKNGMIDVVGSEETFKPPEPAD
jgi:hypothetical protein